MLLQLSIPKCQNIVFNPKLLPLGIFRRTNKVRFPSTIKRLRKQRTEEAKFLREPVEFDPSGDLVENENVEEFKYPFPITETIKILGVKVDSQFTLDEHFKSILTKAAIRQCILTKVSNCH